MAHLYFFGMEKLLSHALSIDPVRLLSEMTGFAHKAALFDSRYAVNLHQG